MPLESVDVPNVSLGPTCLEESEELVSLRVEAMRESLERIGRFDVQRARERFLSDFVPEFTRHILLDGERVGFVTVTHTADGLSLDHLYVRPAYQRRGVGAAVLATLFEEADVEALPLRVGALRGSDSNRFYLRHGFVPLEQGEWDIYYVRPARSQGGYVGA